MYRFENKEEILPKKILMADSLQYNSLIVTNKTVCNFWVKIKKIL